MWCIILFFAHTVKAAIPWTLATAATSCSDVCQRLNVSCTNQYINRSSTPPNTDKFFNNYQSNVPYVFSPESTELLVVAVNESNTQPYCNISFPVNVYVGAEYQPPGFICCCGNGSACDAQLTPVSYYQTQSQYLLINSGNCDTMCPGDCHPISEGGIPFESTLPILSITTHSTNEYIAYNATLKQAVLTETPTSCSAEFTSPSICCCNSIPCPVSFISPTILWTRRTVPSHTTCDQVCNAIVQPCSESSCPTQKCVPQRPVPFSLYPVSDHPFTPNQNNSNLNIYHGTLSRLNQTFYRDDTHTIECDVPFPNIPNADHFCCCQNDEYDTTPCATAPLVPQYWTLQDIEADDQNCFEVCGSNPCHDQLIPHGVPSLAFNTLYATTSSSHPPYLLNGTVFFNPSALSTHCSTQFAPHIPHLCCCSFNDCEVNQNIINVPAAATYIVLNSTQSCGATCDNQGYATCSVPSAVPFIYNKTIQNSTLWGGHDMYIDPITDIIHMPVVPLCENPSTAGLQRVCCCRNIGDTDCPTTDLFTPLPTPWTQAPSNLYTCAKACAAVNLSCIPQLLTAGQAPHLIGVTPSSVTRIYDGTPSYYVSSTSDFYVNTDSAAQCTTPMPINTYPASGTTMLCCCSNSSNCSTTNNVPPNTNVPTYALVNLTTGSCRDYCTQTLSFPDCQDILTDCTAIPFSYSISPTLPCSSVSQDDYISVTPYNITIPSITYCENDYSANNVLCACGTTGTPPLIPPTNQSYKTRTAPSQQNCNDVCAASNLRCTEQNYPISCPFIPVNTLPSAVTCITTSATNFSFYQVSTPATHYVNPLTPATCADNFIDPDPDLYPFPQAYDPTFICCCTNGYGAQCVPLNATSHLSPTTSTTTTTTSTTTSTTTTTTTSTTTTTTTTTPAPGASCPPGTYIVEATCAPCPPGSFTNATNLFSCYICPPGFYAEDYSATSCLPCPTGFFAPYADYNAQCYPWTVCPPSATIRQPSSTIDSLCSYQSTTPIQRNPSASPLILSLPDPQNYLASPFTILSPTIIVPFPFTGPMPPASLPSPYYANGQFIQANTYSVIPSTPPVSLQLNPDAYPVPPPIDITFNTGSNLLSLYIHPSTQNLSALRFITNAPAIQCTCAPFILY